MEEATLNRPELQDRLQYVEKFAFVESSHSQHIRCACFNASGTLLATGGDDNTIRIWNCEEGQLKFEIVGHSAALSVRWTANPFVLLSGFEDGLLVTISISYPTNELVVSGVSHSDSSDTFPIERIAIASGQDQLALGGLDHLELWNTRIGHAFQWERFDELESPPSYARNENQPILVTGVEWLDHPKLVVSYMYHGIVCWDTVAHNALYTIPIPTSIGSMAISPDCRLAAVYNMMNGVDVWDLGMTMQISRCLHRMGENFPLPTLFIHNGMAVICGNAVGDVGFWDVDTGENISILHHKDEIVQALAAFYIEASDTFLIATAASPRPKALKPHLHTVRIWEAAPPDKQRAGWKVGRKIFGCFCGPWRGAFGAAVMGLLAAVLIRHTGYFL